MATGLLKYTPPAVPAALTGWLAPGVSFTISNTNVDSDLTAAVVLITFTDNAYFYNALANGYDVRFTNAAGTVLTHQRLSFTKGASTASGTFLVVSDVDHDAATVIKGYCGKADASDTSSTDVWASSYKGVWPLTEAGGTAVGNYKDLTSAAHHSVNTTNQPTAISGPVAGVGASTFNGSTYVQIAEGVAVGGTGFTIEGLCKFAAWNNDANYIAQRQNPNSIQVSTMASGEMRLSLWLASETSFDTSGAGCEVDTWYYFAATYNGTNVILRIYSAAGLVHEQSFDETGTIATNIGYTYFASNSWSAVACNLGFWRISNAAVAEDLIKFTAAQLLTTGSQLTVANIAGTWAAVTDGEVTGEMLLACEAATTTTAVWAEIRDPEDVRYIWNGTAYVDCYTLADTAAWQACLVPMWAQTLADDTITVYRVGQVPAALAGLPFTVRYFSSDTRAPGDVPIDSQVGQTLASLCRTNPSAGLAYMR